MTKAGTSASSSTRVGVYDVANDTPDRRVPRNMIEKGALEEAAHVLSGARLRQQPAPRQTPMSTTRANAFGNCSPLGRCSMTGARTSFVAATPLTMTSATRQTGKMTSNPPMNVDLMNFSRVFIACLRLSGEGLSIHNAALLEVAGDRHDDVLAVLPRPEEVDRGGKLPDRDPHERSCHDLR